MSRSKRRRPKYVLEFIPRKAMPFVLGGVVLLTLIGIGALLVSNMPPNYRPEVTGAPGIKVDEPFVDLGDMRFNTPAMVTYVIRNVGDEPLRIVEVPQVEILEGC